MVFLRRKQNVISTFDITRDELLARVNELNLRARASIILSQRLIDQSFLRFKQTYRNHYTVRASPELNAEFKAMDWCAMTDQLMANGSKTEDCVALSPGRSAAKMTCDHCEGNLLNNMAYRVRTEDSGKLMLNMTVCYACKLEAENLGLKTEHLCEIESH
jgi:hypothetical protein